MMGRLCFPVFREALRNTTYSKEFFMKKALITVLVSVLAITAFGCRSDGQERLADNPDIPSFVANPPTSDDFIYGTGSAKMNNPSQSMQAADARARTELAARLSVQVQAMIVDYNRTAGTENDQASLSFYESVSRQLTNATLTGAEPIQREQTRDGSYWTLMRMSKADAARQAADAINDVYENEASRYAEFKAMDALKMMEDQLNRGE
jgi:hypothetical protein